MASYRISELAGISGVPATTLRFYDASGLLPAARSSSGHRVYDESALTRLSFIDVGKQLGLSLQQIAEIATARDTDSCTHVKEELRSRLEIALADTSTRQSELDGFAARIRAALDHLSNLPERTDPCDRSCELPADRAAEPDTDHSAARAHTRDSTRPVACSLAAGDVDARIARWHAVLHNTIRRKTPDGYRATVPATRLPALTELAVAEQECCPFLDFSLHLDRTDVHLSVRAPAEGLDLLDELFGEPADHRTPT